MSAREVESVSRVNMVQELATFAPSGFSLRDALQLLLSQKSAAARAPHAHAPPTTLEILLSGQSLQSSCLILTTKEPPVF